MHNYFEQNKALLANRGFLSNGHSPELMPDIEVTPTRIGQDYAFSNERFYFRHSELEAELLEKLNHNSTLAQSHQQKTKENKAIQILCNDGVEKWTNQTMYSYQRGIEQIAQINPDKNIFNLCSHGAKIDHIHSLESVSELIHLLKETYTSA